MKNNKLNICFVVDLIHSSPRIHNLANELESMGNTVTVICKKITSEQKIKYGINNIKYKLIESRFIFSEIELNKNKSRHSLLNLLIISKILFLEFFRRYNPLPPHFNFKYFSLYPWYIEMYMLFSFNFSKPDFIISSSSPFECHVICSKLSRKFNIAWVADYRDLWSENHNIDHKIEKQILFEKQVLSNAVAITTVSTGFSKKMRSYTLKPIKTIYNGYKKNNENSSQYLGGDSKKRILYSGAIYEKKQNFEILLETFKKGDVGNKYDIIFLGSSSKIIEKYYLRKNTIKPNYIKLIGPVDRSTSYKFQQECEILITFDWEDENYDGIIPTKFMEYLGTNNYMIITGSKNKSEIRSILEITKSGTYVSHPNEFYELLLNGNFSRQYNQSVKDYSYEEISKNLMRFLFCLLAGSK